MASTSKEIVCVIDDDNAQSVTETPFNHENIKKKFDLFLNRLCPKTVNLNNPCWATVIKFVINAIIDAKEKEKKNETLDHFAECAMKTYDVIKIDEKDTLILKDKSEEPIIVVPNEECFEILANIHLSNNHANHETMMSLIKPKYLISEENVALFVKLCNICNANELFVIHSYYIFIIELLQFEDKPYRYLLTLVEKSTKFFIIRPLAMKSATEIAVELLKIFADFGPPISLWTFEPEFYIPINAKVTQMCPEFNVLIETAPWSKMAKFEELVKYEICEWIAMTGCTNWASGCRMVQWRINNIETNNKTPFELLFGIRPNDSLNTNPVWLRVSDAEHDKTCKLVKDFRYIFGVQNKDADNLHQLSNMIVNTPNEESKPEEVDQNYVNEGKEYKCNVCQYPITMRSKISLCTSCQFPIHSFCGTRFAGKMKRLSILCVKCKK